MVAPIFAPAPFIMVLAQGAYFAITGRVDARPRDAEILQIPLGRFGTLLAQDQVICERAALVAMPLDRRTDVGVLRQPRGLIVEDGARLRIDVVHVDREIDRVRRDRAAEIRIRSGY